MRGEEARERIRRIFENGPRLAGFYSFAINNPHLSFWNAVQIYSANPNVTVCKSFDDWHEQDNRRIKRGEHGIVYYDEDNPWRKRHVFDISQTYGKERYRGVQHRMREKMLADCINGQNIFAGISRDEESPVKTAVRRYCQEHYLNSEGTEEYDEQYLSCLTEGVTRCICAFTGNAYDDVGALPFDEDTNFRLCVEVFDLVEGLQDAVIESEQRREEAKKERERKKVARQTFNEEGDLLNEWPQYSQLSLWDFAEGISENRIPDAISDSVDDGRIVRASEENRESSTGAQTPIDSGSAFGQLVLELPEELAGQSDGGNGNREDYIGGNRVPAARNYRLTEENFQYATGAKTRYRQNIDAIKVMLRLRSEGKQASDEEKATLSKYVGWGGLAYAFDPEKPEWAKEYAELNELLDPEEYRLAKESVLSAHYTPKTIIDGIYSGLSRMGFTKGKILEPAMGIGNFIGLLPETFDPKETYGVEIDSLTGSIAKLLYPQTKVKIQGFEETNFANNSFDAVITNVPFGSFKVYDKEYDRLGFYIHNYFLAKSLDKIRPGGIIAAITTKGTMDRADTSVRQYIANRAKLLGAIRLPNTAFKTSAGTEVTADILFFQKRDRIVEKAKESWINVGTDENGVPVNQYFIEHPEMLLGTMVQHKSMYGRDDETELLPDERELGRAIAEAVTNLPENIYDASKAVPVGKTVAEAEIEIDEEHKDLKNFCYVFIGDTLYQREGDRLHARDIAKTNVERMRALIGLREQVRTVLNVQLDNCSDEVLRREQSVLNSRYDSFVRKYGIVNSRTNRGLFREDADFALLISIEDVDEKSGTAKKTDVFSKRTIKPYEKITHCDSALQALYVCKSEKGQIDLVVDEAHKYKNKFIFTKMNNVAGISRAMSQRATDMDLKCEYIGELRGGDRGVTFATGTPISNSLVEMYTMQSYLQRRELKNLNLHFFDAWASMFTETVTGLELAPSGQGYRTRTRVAKFTNLPELLKMYRSFADVKTADMLNLPVPNAKKPLIKCEPSEDILRLNDEIVERSERIAAGSVNPRIDNMLCVTHDGKMIALDPRCYDMSIPDDPANKVNQCVGNVYKIWSESKDKRSTQIIFCDMSAPKKEYEDYDPLKDFDVYNDIKRKLVTLGVPAGEVAYIHSAKTDQQKQDMFDRVRRGEIRVLIGSTEKCGAGTNIQNKLIALHHLDTPFRPSDLEQREGRIVRQGNENETVWLYTYVTEKTFDSYSYQILETKQRFISQINHGDYTVREAEDIDDTTLIYAQVKAITSGNPKIMRKMEIEQRLGQLSSLENDYRNNRYRYQEIILHTPK